MIWGEREREKNGRSDCWSGGQHLVSHISDWPCWALWVGGWRLPAAKMTSKSGCVCQPASLTATPTPTSPPHLGTASQVRSRDNRCRRAWSGWSSSPQVSTGSYYSRHSRVLPREALFCPRWGPVNMAFKELRASSSPFRLLGEPWDLPRSATN